MKDVKQKAVAPTPQDDGGTEARFADVCKSALDLDESTANEAIDLFRKCKPFLLGNLSALGSGSPEEFECYWTAFVLYCIVKLRDGRPKVENGEGRFNLSLILRAAKVNAVGFFREMPYFLLKAGHILGNQYGSDWERRLEVKEAQANFVHLKLLSDYYRRAYKEFFLPRCMGDGNHCANPGNIGFVSEYHRFGWFLFLALRIHAFSSFKDLVTCTHGLISILAILILHVPISLRKFSVLDSSKLVKKSDKGVELLASLCDTCHTSEDDLRTAMEKTNCLIVEILKKKPRPASECQAETLANINEDGLTYFEDLLEENSLQHSLLILEKDYADAVDRKGELDERLFVDDEDSLLGTGSLSGGAVEMHSSKRKFDKMVSPTKAITSKLSPPRSPATPAKGNTIGSPKMAPTPVSTAMTTAKWLRTIISPLMSKPSTELEHFLSSCNSDVTRHVILRANIILEAIFPSSFRDQSVAEASQSTSMKDGIWAEQRKIEALKLYYRVLEAMCRAESQILNGNNLTSLLSNDRFHRCMLACCAELVLATHKTVSMMFPAVLERSGITAFDLSKVIESFIRHEESLPRELKRHLNSLEERLLESMAWEKGSSLYNSLIVARPSLSAEINHLGLLAEPMPSLDAVAMRHSIHSEGLRHLPLPKQEISSDHNVDICSPKRVRTELQSTLVEHKSFNSPVKERVSAFNSPRSKLPPLQSAFASPTRPNPAGSGETCGETGISVLFSKIVKLAAIRIRSLSEKLQLSHQVQECVYYLIQQILNQRTFLFFNRHIDQLILCCFYGVAKISQLPLTFKEIINCYRKQSHCKAQVYRSVFVDWSSTRHSERTGQDHVDIITFYNKVFIPSVKPLLVELGPAGSKLQNNQPPEDCSSADGPPQLSPFPSLPDMSPKKVSATHNVYVSPLRTSKMDSLLSPSSKSYYACVGESTHAYQSPSKDLTAINNRLNSGRKVKLNFDVVSDSLVAGSLCSQNSSSSSSPAVVGASHPVVKREQLDF